MDQIRHARQLDRYEAAVKLWVAWHQVAELLDRTAPHAKAQPTRGVRPNGRYPVVRQNQLRLHRAANLRDWKLRRLEMLPEVAEYAKHDALARHENWLAINPCDCSLCVRAAAA